MFSIASKHLLHPINICVFKPVHFSELMAYFKRPKHLICVIVLCLLSGRSDTFNSHFSTRSQAKAAWSCGHTLFMYLHMIYTAPSNQEYLQATCNTFTCPAGYNFVNPSSTTVNQVPFSVQNTSNQVLMILKPTTQQTMHTNKTNHSVSIELSVRSVKKSHRQFHDTEI